MSLLNELAVSIYLYSLSLFLIVEDAGSRELISWSLVISVVAVISVNFLKFVIVDVVLGLIKRFKRGKAQRSRKYL